MKFSMDTVKKNLRWIVGAFLGLFHFILLAIPYASAFASFGSEKQSEGISGYTTLSEFGDLDAGFLVVLFQILALICAVVLLLSSAYVLVKTFFGEQIAAKTKFNMPDAFGPVEVKQVASLALLGYAAVNGAVFLSTVIVSIANTQSMFGISAGIGLGFGVFLAVILSFGAFFGLRFVEKKYPEWFGGEPAPIFACEQCGEPAKATVAFCSKCGGKIIQK